MKICTVHSVEWMMKTVLRYIELTLLATVGVIRWACRFGECEPIGRRRGSEVTGSDKLSGEEDWKGAADGGQ